MNSAPTSASNWKASYLALTTLLVRRRAILRITQSDMADKLKIGRRTFQRWESGEIDPPGMDLFRWAAELGVNIAPHVAQLSEGETA